MEKNYQEARLERILVFGGTTIFLFFFLVLNDRVTQSGFVSSIVGRTQRIAAENASFIAVSQAKTTIFYS